MDSQLVACWRHVHLKIHQTLLIQLHKTILIILNTSLPHLANLLLFSPLSSNSSIIYLTAQTRNTGISLYLPFPHSIQVFTASQLSQIPYLHTLLYHPTAISLAHSSLPDDAKVFFLISLFSCHFLIRMI